MLNIANFAKKQMKWSIVIIDIIILLAVVILCINYVLEVYEDKMQAAKKSFSLIVSTKADVAKGFMTRQQEYCNNWAAYIQEHDYTLEEALQFVSQVNSNEQIMIHIVDYDTMSGLSSVADADGNNTIQYSQEQQAAFNEIKENFSQNAQEIEELVYSDETYVYNSSTYINPINGVECIGFCNPVVLKDSEGNDNLSILVRVVPVEMLKDMWAFTYYASAEIALVEKDGNIMIDSATLTGENFWDLLRLSNDISDDEINDYLTKFEENKITIMELNSPSGEEAYYICIQIKDNPDKYFIGYTTVDNIFELDTDWELIGYVVAGFLCLLFVDGIVMLRTNQQLIKSSEEAQNANLAKSRFLSSMSHDIRTPMNAIIGMTTIATNNLDNKEKLKECLNKINSSSNHLLTLINDILDLSKVESGKMTLNPVTFSISNSLYNLVSIVKQQVREKNLDFNVYVSQIEHEYIFADELRLNQIFINLLTNAVKYTPVNGKVSIYIEERSIPDESKHMQLIYTVQDTGIGMSKEFMEHMYELFTREKDSRVDTIQGSGLGLSITKQMVELMGGTIDCQSELEKGTKFTVTLNLAIADSPANELVLPDMNILLVDDDKTFLETAKDTLSSMGAKVDIANSGSEAIELVSKQHKLGNDYPVIIMDWKMSDMDGIETTRKIRKKIGADKSIIIISAYDWTDVEDTAKKAGANGFINKPFLKSTVYSAINQYFHFSEESKIEEMIDNGEDLSGMNLLIAEDNDLNWEIIEELLKTANITSERAKNGLECINKLQDAPNGTYDAILMDVQMPKMNGYEATSRIRKLEDKNKRKIGIIAMTADAFTNDVRKCIDIGMNAHVAKPIDMKKLFAALRKVKRK